MKKWFASMFVAVLTVALMTPADASHSETKRVEVMSQNLYIGADLSRLLAGEDPAAILETVQQTNFPARAVEIAEAFDDFEPALVGLQEVSIISVFDSAGNVLFELDYLEILLAATAEEDLHYEVGSSVTNADVTLPVDLAAGIFARVIDRDVIIYDAETTSVSHPRSANFSTNFTVELGGFPIEFTRGFTMVNADIGGRQVRFVNTHLEVEGAPCLTETGLVICQDVQAEELVQLLGESDMPTMLVGDFNAQPGMPAYETIIGADYTDTWTLRYPYNDEPGFTCCQAEDLLNIENLLDQRIDHIFIADLHSRFTLTTVVGDWEERKTPGGLWYSDHGGPWARMYLVFDS